MRHWPSFIRRRDFFIGGGHTPTYHRLYATEPIRSAIRERHWWDPSRRAVCWSHYNQVCVLIRNGAMRLPGRRRIGSSQGCSVEAHFARCPPDLVSAMAPRTSIGWGIDESACAVLRVKLIVVLSANPYTRSLRVFDTSPEVVDCSTSYPVRCRMRSGDVCHEASISSGTHPTARRGVPALDGSAVRG